MRSRHPGRSGPDSGRSGRDPPRRAAGTVNEPLTARTRAIGDAVGLVAVLVLIAGTALLTVPLAVALRPALPNPAE